MTDVLHTVDCPDGITLRRKASATVRPDHGDRIDAWIDEMATELGMHPDDVASLAAALLIRRRHDEVTYRRVAGERGVLAL